MKQAWQPALYAENGRFVALLASSLLEELRPQAGERILDLGCGDGYLTQQIQQSGADVLGVDASEQMVAAAIGRGLNARYLDGEALAFDGEFDAVFSNAALHWMNDQDAVLAGVYRSLKPGGRFVAECGGQGNIAAIRVALLAVLTAQGVAAERIENNCFFGDQEYRARVEHHGFVVEDIRLIPRPTPLPSGMANWLKTFRSSVLEAVPEGRRAAAVDQVVAWLAPVLCDREGNWTADYMRLRFRAVRPL